MSEVLYDQGALRARGVELLEHIADTRADLKKWHTQARADGLDPSTSVKLASHRELGAAQSTIDALMHSLRRGLSALGPSDSFQTETLRRLSELSKGQIKDCCLKLWNRKPEIGQAWTKNEVRKLISVWKKVCQ